MKSYQASAIVANSGDIRDVLFVQNGKFYCPGDIANNALNIGLREPIPWGNIQSVDVIPYAAGSYKTVQINFNSGLEDWTAGERFDIVIRGDNKTFNTYVYSPDSLIVKTLPDTHYTTYAEMMRDLFYKQLQQNPYLAVTKTSTYKLNIQGRFGVSGFSNTDFTISTSWGTSGTVKTITNIETHGDGSKITCIGHGLQAGDYVYIYDVTWTAEPTGGDFSDNPYVVVTRVNADSYTVALNFEGATYNTGGSSQQKVVRTSTDYQKPEGTEDIVHYQLPDYTVTGRNAYYTFLITHYIDIAGGSFGHKAHKEVVSTVFIEDHLVALHMLMDAIIAGIYHYTITVTGITKADPAVVTCDGHALAIGDQVYIHSSDEPDFNGLVSMVSSITDATEFTLELDASGFAGAATTAIMESWNPQAHYLAK